MSIYSTLKAYFFNISKRTCCELFKCAPIRQGPHIVHTDAYKKGCELDGTGGLRTLDGETVWSGEQSRNEHMSGAVGKRPQTSELEFMSQVCVRNGPMDAFSGCRILI